MKYNMFEGPKTRLNTPHIVSCVAVNLIYEKGINIT